MTLRLFDDPEPSCVTCGSGTDNGRISFRDGECYRCSISGIAFGKVPVSPDGVSNREMRERHKQWGQGNLGVDIVDADIGELIDRATVDGSKVNRKI